MSDLKERLGAMSERLKRLPSGHACPKRERCLRCDLVRFARRVVEMAEEDSHAPYIYRDRLLRAFDEEMGR